VTRNTETKGSTSILFDQPEDRDVVYRSSEVIQSRVESKGEETEGQSQKSVPMSNFESSYKETVSRMSTEEMEHRD
jgi:hypothetical protein